MASDNAISIRIGADSSGFRSGAKEAEDQVSELSAKLREFKSEHVQTARATRFFSNEIEHLGLVSNEASGAIGSLIAGFAVGGGIGVAIGAVKVLVGAIHSIGEESAKEAEELKKLAEASKTFIEGQAKALEDFLAALEGQTEAQKIARKEAGPLLKEETALTGQLAEVREHLAKINENVDENGMVADIVALNKATKEEIDLQAKLALVQGNLGAVRKRLGGTAVGEDAAAEGVAAAARRKEAATALNALLQARALMLAAENTVTTDIWSKDVERQQVAFDSAETLKKQEADYALMVRDAENFLDPLRAALFAEQEAAAAEAEKDAILRQEQASAKKLAGELEHAAKNLGSEFGSAIGEMIRGTKSLDDVIGEMLQSLLKAAIQLAAMQAFAAGGPLGILGGIGIEAIGGALGGLLGGGGGGGGGGNVTVNMSNSFHGNALDAANSQQFQTAVINTIRTAQRRGRL